MAKIQVLEGPMSGAQFELKNEVVFVGRDPDNDFQIHDEAVSKRHLKIFSVESCYFVEDLKSRNGTLINGAPLDAGFARLITENDRIQLGSSVIRLDGIGVNAPPMTMEEMGPHRSEKLDEPKSSSAYWGEERRSRASKEMNIVYDLLQLIGKKLNSDELVGKVTEFLFESYPRIDRISAFLLDNEKNRMQEIISRSRQGTDKETPSYTKAILDQVVQEGKIVSVHLKAAAARHGSTNVKDTVALMAVVYMPLMSGEKLCGAINIEGFGESNPLREDDFLLMKTIKSLLELNLQIADLSERAALASPNRKRR